MHTVIVIGAGAAGLMAAVAAAKSGSRVLLFEKNDIVGKKMGITGKGRCNLTNICTVPEFIERTPGNGKFLYSVYRQFDNQDFLALLTDWQLATKVERGGRVFPESDSAIEVRKLFYKKLKGYNVELFLNDKALKVRNCELGKVEVTCSSGVYEGDACIISTGGISYPQTGCTGDGYRFARRLGHTVTDLKPSLIPLVSDDEWVKELQGISLRNVAVSLWHGEKELAHQFGEMIFTHFGVSGPTILSLSNTATKHEQDLPLQLQINLKPALTDEVLDDRIQRDFQKYSRKQIENGMTELLPQRMILAVLRQARIDPTKTVNQITKEERLCLGKAMHHFSLTISGTRPIEEAIVTAGGIALKEINPSTMESKLVPGLFFAGEVLDVDAYTGGYNLQAAFSTGYVAGAHASERGVTE